MDVKITFDRYNVIEADKINDVKVVMVKGEKGDVGYPTDAQVETAVDEWLTAHPEVTTTVQDGSITEAKLANDVKGMFDEKADAIIKTSSGDIASFTDGGNGLLVKSLIANITPIQSGSGDPSPSNVRPISGYEGVNVNRVGKNWLFFPYTDSSGTSNGITWTVNDDGTVTANGTATANSIFYIAGNNLKTLKPNTEYILSACPSDSNVYAQFNMAGSKLASTNGTTRFTTPSTAGTGLLFLIVLNGKTVNNFTFSPMIRLASDTDSTYEKPKETTSYPISLGQTVYGGTLDVVSGKLTAFPYYSSYNGQTLNGEWICDRAVYSQGVTPPTGSQVVDMSGTGSELTLTPTEVNTLLGQNNIWADSGSVEVEYRADTTLAYNELLSLIASL